VSSLLLLNGSPRGKSANTALLLAQIAQGWENVNEGEIETLHLTKSADFERATKTFGEADVVVLGMPLYTDGMPGLVMKFIEELAPYVGKDGNPTIGFLVQSGFNEALHSRHLERYLEKLARRLGCEYAGTIVKGGGEGLRQMPPSWTRKLFGRVQRLGESLAREGRFDAELLRDVAGTERFTRWQAFWVGLFTRTPIGRMYWNGQLKKNGAFADRWAAPYAKAAER